MNALHFDHLSRALSLSTSRRGAVATLLAGVLVALDIAPTAAKKGKTKKKRKGKGTTSQPPICLSGSSPCGNACAVLTTDGANCGRCGHVCATGGCTHGACTCSGQPGQCPMNCPCGVRRDGGAACLGFVTEVPCAADADCPLGGFCLILGVCTSPCLG